MSHRMLPSRESGRSWFTRGVTIVVLMFVCGVGISYALAQTDSSQTSSTNRPVRVHPRVLLAPTVTDLNLQDRLNRLDVEMREDGKYHVRFRGSGGPVWVSGDEFLDMLHEAQQDQHRRGWVYVLLNITKPMSILWVVVGLAGQVAFTGRMVVQWIASEKAQRSVIPPVFWWMSLIGAVMLMIYFIWRKDIVGVLGQSTGLFIYVRNLWMIHRPAKARAVVA